MISIVGKSKCHQNVKKFPEGFFEYMAGFGWLDNLKIRIR